MRAAVAALAAAVLAAPASAAVTPNDPKWPEQWAQRHIGMPAVWEVTTGDPSVVIASIDTGVNPAIPDLQGALAPGWDFTDGDDQIDDVNWHGTVMATTAVARGNNGIGIAGYCWGCRLMPVRVTVGSSVSDDSVAAGLRWAVDHGARIVILGFGSTDAPNATLAEALSYAVGRGALMISPAGHRRDGVLSYPGAFPGVLAVASTDENDALYPWSNRGDWIPLAAPGCHMAIGVSNVVEPYCYPSYAAAAVAGVAGLALSRNPSLSAAQLATALRSTAKPVQGIGGGRIDAYAALGSLGLLTPPPPPAPPPPAGPPPPRTPPPAAPPPPATPLDPPPTTTPTPAGPTVKTSKRVLGGTLRGSKRVPLAVGGGTVAVTLRLAKAARCTLTLPLTDRVVIARQPRRNVFSLAADVKNGRYTLELACRDKQPRRYTLSITAPAPVAAR